VGGYLPDAPLSTALSAPGWKNDLETGLVGEIPNSVDALGKDLLAGGVTVFRGAR
jgi:hypothetical protein